MSAETPRERALELHQAGAFEQAERLYLRLLEHAPDDPYLLFYSAILAYQTNQLEKAVGLFQRVLAIEPGFAGAHANLGLVLHDLGRFEESLASCDAALGLQPESAEIHYNRGQALLSLGRLQEALSAYDHCLALRPDDAQAHSMRGMCLHDLSRYEDALACYDRALHLNPGFAKALNNRGVSLAALRRFDKAIQCYAAALKTDPHLVEARNNWGLALKSLRRFEEALDAFNAALEISPKYLDACINSGEVLMRLQREQEAVQAYRAAAELAPNDPCYSWLLGKALEEAGRLDEALECWRPILQQQPDDVRANASMAGAYLCLGDLQAALRHYRATLDVPSRNLTELQNSIAAYGGYLYSLNLGSDMSPAFIFQQHINFAKKFANALLPEPLPRLRTGVENSRIRVGYTSADFRGHSVSYFLRPVLACHNREAFEIYGYFNAFGGDATTLEFTDKFDHWRDIAHLNNKEMAACIRKDEIDILIDLSGHTQGNSLLALAYKPAPIQVTWIGYPNTTGLAAMDYRIVDSYTDPDGLTDACNTEQLVRMPRNFSCYEPPKHSPEVTPPPVSNSGFLTFGSFNNPMKINQRVLEVWSRILNSVPNSRLFLKGKCFKHTAAQERILSFFVGAGVAEDRIIFAKWTSSSKGHLNTYGDVDIALDPFPYNGTTTTCEALWMGVPVIALAGDTHVSRVGVSLLSNTGLTDLIATDPDHYVELASKLAGDIPRLQSLRLGMRQRLLQSPLLDAGAFTKDLEERFKWMVARAQS